ncbi:MAG: PRC-barrel domain-containing protein, partial [Limisphaerales bacterium]
CLHRRPALPGFQSSWQEGKHQTEPFTPLTMNMTHKILTPAIILATLAFSAPGEEHQSRPGGINDPAHRTDSTHLQGSQSLGTLTKLSDVVGSEVHNRQGEKLGKVSDAVLDVPAGRLVALIVSTGGVLGVGGRQVTIPPSAFHYDEAKQVLHLDATKESLQNAPEFDSARWEEFRHQPASFTQVYQYHGVTPYFTNGTVNADGSAPGRGDSDRLALTPSEKATAPLNADNSALNRRDRKGNTLTPLDQGNTKDEADVTARIRQDVVAHEGLSVTAKNVKIITSNGRVTLRGPVNSEQERRVIGEIALAANPSGAVDNQLEIKLP